MLRRTVLVIIVLGSILCRDLFDAVARPATQSADVVTVADQRFRLALEEGADLAAVGLILREVISDLAIEGRLVSDSSGFILILPSADSDGPGTARSVLDAYERARTSRAATARRSHVLADLLGLLGDRIQSAPAAVDSKTRSLIEQLEGLQLRLSAAEEQQTAGAARVDALKAELVELREPTRVAEVEARNPRHSRLVEELQELELERARLATKYVEGSVWLRRADEKLNAVKTLLATESEFQLETRESTSGRVRAHLFLDEARARIDLAAHDARVDFLREQISTTLAAIRSRGDALAPVDDEIALKLSEFRDTGSSRNQLPAIRLQAYRGLQ